MDILMIFNFKLYFADAVHYRQGLSVAKAYSYILLQLIKHMLFII